MPRFRPSRIASCHLALGELLVVWVAGAHPSPRRYAARWGVGHLVLAGQPDRARECLEDPLVMEAVIDAFETEVQPLRYWRHFGLHAMDQAYERVAQRLPDTPSEGFGGAVFAVGSFLHTIGRLEVALPLMRWA